MIYTMNKKLIPLFLIAGIQLIFSGCEEKEPPPVNTLSVKKITANSAKSGGNVTDDGGAPVARRGVVWSTSKEPSLEANEGKTKDGRGTGEFTSELTDLNSGTTYYVRAYALNAAGVAYGNQKEFTTAEKEGKSSVSEEIVK